jgi:hypothetical protein
VRTGSAGDGWTACPARCGGVGREGDVGAVLERHAPKGGGYARLGWAGVGDGLGDVGGEIDDEIAVHDEVVV